MSLQVVIFVFCLVVALAHAEPPSAAPPGLTSLIAKDAAPIILENGDSITTGTSFTPPVEITLVAMTDSTNIRMAYAADQVIFNWEVKPTQLRVDGGPANGKHKNDAGQIPVNKYVTIKWLVTDKKQTIRVDDQLRFEHEGDYSKINQPVRVFPNRSKISVKQFVVRPLLAGAK